MSQSATVHAHRLGRKGVNASQSLIKNEAGLCWEHSILNHLVTKIFELMEEMPAHGTAGFISWLAATDLAVTISSVQASALVPVGCLCLERRWKEDERCDGAEEHQHGEERTNRNIWPERREEEGREAYGDDDAVA